MQHEEMINERIDQLIAEYLSGSLTADAFQELKNWSQQSDETRMYVRNQIEVWFSSGVAAKDKVFDKEEAFARFQKRIGNKEQKVYRFSWKTFYRVAAVIIDCAASAGRLLERTGNTSSDVLGYGGGSSVGSTY